MAHADLFPMVRCLGCQRSFGSEEARDLHACTPLPAVRIKARRR